MTAGTINLVQGEDFSTRLTFKNADESAYDLTGATVKFLVRRQAGATPVIEKTVTSHTDAAGGITTVTLSGADTDLAIRAWQYQIVLVDLNGNDHPSGYHVFRVSNSGSTTNTSRITVNSQNVAVTLDMLGSQGVQGVQGPAATISVGSVTTTAPGASATVSNVGTSGSAILNFGLPRGDAGPPGGVDLARASVKTSSYATAGAEIIPVDTTGGSVTITLPNAPANKTIVNVKMVAQGYTSGIANVVTINCSGGDVFNRTAGSTSISLSMLNQSAFMTYASSTGIWSVISSDLALSTLDARFSKRYDIRSFGAKCDGIELKTGAVAAASTALTTTEGLFTASDVGKPISIKGAGTSGRPHATTIAAFVSTTQVTLTAPAVTTVTGADVLWGTDDTVAVQTACNTVNTAGSGTIRIPNGITIVTGTVTIASNMRIDGDGMYSARVCGVGSNFSVLKKTATVSSPVGNLEMCNFWVDGGYVGHTSFATGYKGIFIQYMRNCSFHDLYITNTIATALGIDFGVNCYAENVIAENYGRGWSSGVGGSGIGIGNSGYEVENFVIVNCQTVSGATSGNNGFLYESQLNSIPGSYMTFANCLSIGGDKGYHISGPNHVTMSNCISKDARKNGILIDTTQVSGQANPYDIQVIGGLYTGASKSGVNINNTYPTGGPISRIQFIGVNINGNGTTGEHGIFSNNSADIMVDGCYIYNNGQYGILMTSTNANCPLDNISIRNSKIYNNSVAAPRLYDGVRLQQTVAGSLDNIFITENEIYDNQASATQRYGVSLSAATAASNIMLMMNYFSGNYTAPYATSAGITNLVTILNMGVPSDPILGTQTAGYVLRSDGTKLLQAAIQDSDLPSPLTNKRITKRTLSITSSATPTANTDNYDQIYITALATNITNMSTNLSGTPVIGDTLLICITDNGTPRSIAWGTKFEGSTVTLPTTTVTSTMLSATFIRNTVTSKWRCIGVA